MPNSEVIKNEEISADLKRKNSQIFFIDSKIPWKIGKSTGVGDFSDVHLFFVGTKALTNGRPKSNFEVNTNGSSLQYINFYLWLAKLEITDRWVARKYLKYAEKLKFHLISNYYISKKLFRMGIRRFGIVGRKKMLDKEYSNLTEGQKRKQDQNPENNEHTVEKKLRKLNERCSKQCSCVPNTCETSTECCGSEVTTENYSETKSDNVPFSDFQQRLLASGDSELQISWNRSNSKSEKVMSNKNAPSFIGNKKTNNSFTTRMDILQLQQNINDAIFTLDNITNKPLNNKESSINPYGGFDYPCGCSRNYCEKSNKDSLDFVLHSLEEVLCSILSDRINCNNAQDNCLNKETSFRNREGNLIFDCPRSCSNDYCNVSNCLESNILQNLEEALSSILRDNEEIKLENIRNDRHGIKSEFKRRQSYFGHPHRIPRNFSERSSKKSLINPVLHKLEEAIRLIQRSNETDMLNNAWRSRTYDKINEVVFLLIPKLLSQYCRIASEGDSSDNSIVAMLNKALKIFQSTMESTKVNVTSRRKRLKNNKRLASKTGKKSGKNKNIQDPWENPTPAMLQVLSRMADRKPSVKKIRAKN